MNAPSYFDHAAGRKREPRTSWDVVEWVDPSPVEVEETDDEDTVRIVRIAWLERVERCS